MTIDAAIRYADMLANDASTIWEIPMVEIQRLHTLCADTLRTVNAMRAEPQCLNDVATEVPGTWQNRMKREYRETKERYEKLHKMVTKYEAGTLDFTPNCSIDLLRQQKRHMGEYLHDLEIRAEIEGIEL